MKLFGGKGAFSLFKAIGIAHLQQHRCAQNAGRSLNAVLATITFPNGRMAEYKGKVVGAAAWTYRNDINVLSILAKDHGFNNAFLSFRIKNVNGPGRYSLTPDGLMTSQSRLLWDHMDYERWIGYETGDVYGDGKTAGGGVLTIDLLNEKRVKGSFSMVMTNDLKNSIKVEGRFNSLLKKQIE